MVKYFHRTNENKKKTLKRKWKAAAGKESEK